MMDLGKIAPALRSLEERMERLERIAEAQLRVMVHQFCPEVRVHLIATQAGKPCNFCGQAINWHRYE